MAACRRVAAALLFVLWWGVAAPISAAPSREERQALRERSLAIAQGVLSELAKIEPGSGAVDEPIGDEGDPAPALVPALAPVPDTPIDRRSSLALTRARALARGGVLAGRPRGPPGIA